MRLDHSRLPLLAGIVTGGTLIGRTLLFAMLIAIPLVSPIRAQERFSDLVGNVRVEPVSTNKTVQVPYILWGGDIATFLANGDLKTKQGSIYQQMGLDMQLQAGDDFVGQVRNYLSVGR